MTGTLKVLVASTIGDFDKECLASWLRIDYPNLQYLLNRTGEVVGSSDERNVEAYQIRNEAVTRGRNSYLEESMQLDWDYLLHVDSDVEVPTNLLTEMMKLAPDEKVITAVAKYRPIPGFRENASVLNYRGNDGYAIWTGWHCILIAREVHERVGMFTADIRGEDRGYSQAMQECGYNICIADKVHVIHHYDRTVRKPYTVVKAKASLVEKCPVCGDEGLLSDEENGIQYYECFINHHAWEKPSLKSFASYPGSVDVGGWSFIGEGRILYDLASRSSVEATGCVVELGTYKGLSAIYLASGSPDKIWTVDNHEFGTYQEACQNMATRNLKVNVELIQGYSQSVGKMWKCPIRLLFVDADHSYEGVKNDILTWGPHIVKGGYIIFHDTNYPEITKAIGEFVKPDEFIEVELPNPHGSLRCFKRC